ncbi:MAG TPA: 16S rRNA (cytosine(1402)-N(4))-methyltransferase [Puia sp.]|nr:16S rRNA (cytosine(1402)-N(4))-methyltransferase [Puia sp.]
MLKAITKKPVTPGDTELKENPRSRSAKLRAAQRV